MKREITKLIQNFKLIYDERALRISYPAVNFKIFQ
jgi:hypothetical protein